MSWSEAAAQSLDMLPRSVHQAALLQVRAHRREALLFVLAASVHAAAHGALAVCAALLAQRIAAPSSIGRWGTRLPAPWVLAAFGLLAAVLQAAAGTLATFAQVHLSACAGNSLRERLVRMVLQHGLSLPSPAAMARVSSRVREACNALHAGVLQSVRAIAQLLPLGLALWVTCAPLAALAGTLLLPFAFALAFARSRWRTQHSHYLTLSDALHEELDDLLRHTDLWRSYGTGSRVRVLIEELGARAAAAQARSETVRSALSLANEVLAAAALLLAVAAGQRLPGAVGADLIAFCAVFFMAYRPLRDLGDARAAVLQGNDALNALRAVAAQGQERDEGAPSAAATPHGTSTGVPAEMQPLFVDGLAVPGRLAPVTLVVQPGELVVVAGRTGAGKTTMLRALLGLEPSALGEIRYGSRSLPAGLVGPGHRPFAWVPQEAPVISGTLLDNIRLGGANGDRALDELETIGAADLGARIASVKLGAGGRALSGGERRWLALARALATGLPVLLLDEPTVGLDPEARRTLLASLEKLRGRRTLLVVTHDADVMALGDRVERLGAGTDAESVADRN